MGFLKKTMLIFSTVSNFGYTMFKISNSHNHSCPSKLLIVILGCILFFIFVDFFLAHLFTFVRLASRRAPLKITLQKKDSTPSARILLHSKMLSEEVIYG